MADLDLTAAVEAGARALVAHDGQDWDDLGDIRVSTEVVRNSYREAAEVVLRAGAELIAEQVRQATADDTKRADEALRFARLALRSIADVSSRQAICQAAENAIDLIDAAIARRAGDGDGTAPHA